MEPRTRITLYMPPALLTRLEIEAERRSKLAGVALTAQKVGLALIQEGLGRVEGGGGIGGAFSQLRQELAYEPHKHRAVHEGDAPREGWAEIIKDGEGKVELVPVGEERLRKLGLGLPEKAIARAAEDCHRFADELAEGEGALDRVKRAAQDHGPLSEAEGFADLLGVELTPAERAQLRRPIKSQIIGGIRIPDPREHEIGVTITPIFEDEV